MFTTNRMTLTLELQLDGTHANARTLKAEAIRLQTQRGRIAIGLRITRVPHLQSPHPELLCWVCPRTRPPRRPRRLPSRRRCPCHPRSHPHHAAATHLSGSGHHAHAAAAAVALTIDLQCSVWRTWRCDAHQSCCLKGIDRNQVRRPVKGHLWPACPGHSSGDCGRTTRLECERVLTLGHIRRRARAATHSTSVSPVLYLSASAMCHPPSEPILF